MPPELFPTAVAIDIVTPVQQPPVNPAGFWSPDRQWWWDGRQWIAASQAPGLPPPPGPMMPPPGMYQAPNVYQPGPGFFAPAPGLRTFLLVMLVITSVIWGLLTIFGILGIAGGATETGSLVFFGVIALLFAISLVATIAVITRATWARWAAIAAGVASCLTCLGLVVGIPIVVAAARAPVNRP
jgi:hypothetical protein